jgi:3-isopropylmalate/(R)-2-methylmalate dehydratase small subunit
MEPFTSISGAAAPLMMQNVDTDVIVPIQRLTDYGREQLAPYAFEALRYLDDGEDNPAFLLNNPPWRGAPILLAGANFGCGSSREGAVWALACIGIRCVIAPSFGGIFFNNCFQNGLLPVVLPQATVETLAELARAEPDAPFTVDLEGKLVLPPDGSRILFEIDEVRRQALLQGLDDLGLTLKKEAEIAAFQQRDRLQRPWIYEI